MRLPRMTTRRWMIAVSMEGVLMWGVVRTHDLKSRATYHAQEKQQRINTAQLYEKLYLLRVKLIETASVVMTFWLETQENYEEASELRERAEYHARLELAYRRAISQ